MEMEEIQTSFPVKIRSIFDLGEPILTAVHDIYIEYSSALSPIIQ